MDLLRKSLSTLSSEEADEDFSDDDSTECDQVFFVCSRGGAEICIPFLVVAGLGFGAATVTLVWLWRSRKLRVVVDPVTSVAIADAMVSGTLVWAGVLSLWSPKLLKKWHLRDLIFDLTLSASIAACLFGGLTAYSFVRVVKGRQSRSCWPWHRRWGSSLTKPYRDPSVAIDDAALLPPGYAESTISETESSVVSSAPWTTIAPTTTTNLDDAGVNGSSFLRHVVGVWLFVIVIFVMTSSQTPLPHVDARLAFGVAAVGTFCISIRIAAWDRTIARNVQEAYPAAQTERVRRDVRRLVLTYGVRSLLVSIALLATVFDPNLFEKHCVTPPFPFHRRGIYLRSRIAAEFLWAVSSLVDALAFFSNVGGIPGTSFARSVFPLRLVGVDDKALVDAPLVGQGAFGQVRILDAGFVERLPPREDNYRVVAVKSFAFFRRFTSDSDAWRLLRDSLDDLRSEAYRMATLKHRRIVTLYGIAESPSLGPCLVSEFLDGGSVSDILNNTDDDLPPSFGTSHCARRCARDVAAACKYLHGQNVIHRDLKSANILVDTNGSTKCKKWRFKVSDFGTSRVLLDGLAQRKTRRRKRSFFKHKNDDDVESPRNTVVDHTNNMTLAIGTPLYLAPELCAGDRAYDEKIDVYSYGIILWELCALSTNWYDGDPGPGCGILFDDVARGARPPLKPGFDPALADLMPLCWANSPRDRLAFADIYKILDDLQFSSQIGDIDETVSLLSVVT